MKGRERREGQLTNRYQWRVRETKHVCSSSSVHHFLLFLYYILPVSTLSVPCRFFAVYFFFSSPTFISLVFSLVLSMFATTIISGGTIVSLLFLITFKIALLSRNRASSESPVTKAQFLVTRERYAPAALSLRTESR